MFLAAIISMPVACVAFGIADKTTMPDVVKWVMAPGYYLGLWYQSSHPSHGLSFALGGVVLGLFLNALYYVAPLYFIVRASVRLPKIPRLKRDHDVFWM
jgi:hypothetical protein